MHELYGYNALKNIYSGKYFKLFRAIEERTGQKVIIKTFSDSVWNEAAKANLKYEYDVGKYIHSLHVIRYLAIESQSAYIVLEDDNAIDLKQFLSSRKISLELFLNIAIQLIEGLHDIHQANVVHGDIKPSNLIINPDTFMVKYIDLGSAMPFHQKGNFVAKHKQAKGTLAYISPEKTGRTNLQVDYRTDFYSLGVTFYEFLTGQLPFDDTSPRALLHSHIAEKPQLLQNKQPSLPLVISNIVMKLLAKDPDDRYQSCAGIMADLKKCRDQLTRTGEIQSFEIASHDVYEILHIQQKKIYGREKEIATLQSAFEQVRTGSSELLTVSGYSGVGKTTLINELQKPVMASQGYFISGKFDQLNRTIAYSAIKQALQSLVKQLLSESDAVIQQWRQKIVGALGNNCQLVIELIKDLEIIVGKQSLAAEVGAAEAENRFNLVLQQFIKLFCQPQKPLVLFLDDIQWGDLASLKLIQYIITHPDTHNLLLIGAYRDNEVNANHPTMMTIEAIKKSRVTIVELKLAPLDKNHINQWLADMLNQPIENVKPLGRLIYHKTEGNPFFAKIFLRSLYDEKLLSMSLDKGWVWDIEKIRYEQTANNIIELLLRKINQFEPSVREMMKIVSCLGNRFKLETLSMVTQTSRTNIYTLLEPVLSANLLYRIDEELVFAHDRVQEAFYTLLSQQERQKKHLEIGRLLLESHDKNKTDELLFDVVDHLNQAAALIENETERLKLAQLNLQGGEKAKQAIAYKAALDYLHFAQSYLPQKNVWQAHYMLAFNIHKTLAEIEYLNGHFEISLQVVERTLPELTSIPDKIELYSLLIIQKTLQGQYDEAVQFGRAGLALVEINLPSEKLLPNFFKNEMPVLKKLLANKKIEELLNSPTIQRQDIKATLKILFTLYMVGYLSGSDLLSFSVIQLVKLSLEYGHAPESCMGYAAYGMLLCATTTDYAIGYQFGKLAIKLSEKFHNNVQKCRSYNLIVNCIHNWSQPLHTVNDLIEEGYHAGLESGELQYAAYLVQYKARILFEQGLNLTTLAHELKNLLNFCKQPKNQVAIDLITSVQIVVENLLARTSHDKDFQFEGFTDVDYQQHCQTTNSICALPLYRIMKAQVLYLYGYYEEALKELHLAEKQFAFIPGQFTLSTHNFYLSLVLIALYPKAGPDLQAQYRHQIEKNQAHMKIWADACPSNFLYRYQLVAAELAKISGNWREAEDLYEAVMQSAKENSFAHHYALGCELAAKFWLGRNKPLAAQGYLNEAYKYYYQWGAERKIKNLHFQYPELIKPVKQRKLSNFIIDSQTTLYSEDLKHLDLASILNTSQMISSQLDNQSLLKYSMNVIIESTGAQKGTFILMHAGIPYIEAECLEKQEISLPNIPLTQWQKGSQGIIDYVKRTQQSLILGNASEDQNFNADNYIHQQKVLSVLCMPIIKQAELKGFIYLENNLATHVFTQQHFYLLTILVNQIIISWENIFIINENIIAAKQLAEQSARVQEAEHYNKNQSEFTARICHEIRNPLNGIYGNVELIIDCIKNLRSLLSDNNNPNLKPQFLQSLNTLQECTDSINECATHQKTITDEVLDLSKLEANELIIEATTYNPKQVIFSVITMFKSRCLQKGLKIDCKVPPDDIWVEIDPKRFKVILINLFSNALKFTQNGSITIQLEIVRINSLQATLQVKITDTGIGMKAEEKSRIFQRFKQGSSSTYQNYGGSGMGLYISKRLIELMGGTIEVSSEEGKGTQFTFTISAPITHQSQFELQKSLQPLTLSYLSENKTVSRPNVILIVDDNKMNQNILASYFTKAGYLCVTANNGKEALEKIEKNNFSLIFMDILMPNMDGLEATRKIRENEFQLKQNHKFIIGLSGNAQQGDKDLALAAGMDDYVTKPFKRDEILKKVIQYIGGSGLPVIVTFSYLHPDAKSIHLAGNFNDWINAVNGKISSNISLWSMPKESDGMWRITMLFMPGTYHFKYVIDYGKSWEQDPTYNCTNDSYQNTILEVAPTSLTVESLIEQIVHNRKLYMKCLEEKNMLLTQLGSHHLTDHQISKNFHVLTIITPDDKLKELLYQKTFLLSHLYNLFLNLEYYLQFLLEQNNDKAFTQKNKKYIHIGNTNITFSETSVVGDNWAILRAVNIKDPILAIKELMQNLNNPHIVNAVRQSIENNYFKNISSGNPFVIKGKNKESEINEIAESIKEHYENYQTCNVSDKHQFYTTLLGYLEKPDVQRAYLNTLLDNTHYADPSLAEACLILQGKQLALFIDYGLSSGQLINYSSESIDIFHPNTVCIVYYPNNNYRAAQYSILQPIKDVKSLNENSSTNKLPFDKFLISNSSEKTPLIQEEVDPNNLTDSAVNSVKLN